MYACHHRFATRRGFTLIELGIVLVIIGLIVGGVLVGQDLIKAAQVRAQATQIEKYNSAVNTFRSKYNALPGDMSINLATQFGFTIGTNCTGQMAGRDGNGLIDGWINKPLLQGAGEVEFFWQDLTGPGGNFIEGTYPNSGTQAPNCTGAGYANLSSTSLSGYFPAAKIGYGNYIYVYENNSVNWYGLSAVTSTIPNGQMSSSVSLPVILAYNLDKKMDDGMPAGGTVQVQYINGYNTMGTPATTSTPGGNSSSCYDTTTNTYSITSAAVLIQIVR